MNSKFKKEKRKKSGFAHIGTHDHVRTNNKHKVNVCKQFYNKNNKIWEKYWMTCKIDKEHLSDTGC